MSWKFVIAYALFNLVVSGFGLYALVFTFGAWNTFGLLLASAAGGGLFAYYRYQV